MNEVISPEEEKLEIERLLNDINEKITLIDSDNQKLKDYLTKMVNIICNKFKDNRVELKHLLQVIKFNVLKDVVELLNLKQCLEDDILHIYNNPIEYDYIGFISLLNERRKALNKYTKKYKSHRQNDEVSNLIKEASESFTKLQALIIAKYVQEKLFLDEIHNGRAHMNKITLWDDNFADRTIIGDQEIDRLIQYLHTLEINDKSQKEELEYYLTLKDNIKRNIGVWKIVAKNLDIMTIMGYDEERAILVENNTMPQEASISYNDLEKGDLTKLVRNIPMSEKLRLERSWLKLHEYTGIDKIPDKELCIPDEREILSILIDIICIKEKHFYRNSTDESYEDVIKFYSQDGILNCLEVNPNIDSVLINIIKGNKATKLEFSSAFFKTLLFIKELDTIFPELYILSDCIDELIQGKKHPLNRILTLGRTLPNLRNYSKIFKICCENWDKLKMMEKSSETHLNLNKILKSRKKHYDKYFSELYNYETVKNEYSYGRAEDFLEKIKKVGLSEFKFPITVRRKLERILCEIENIQISDDMLYTPTNEEILMMLETIIEKKCTENNLEQISFIDKDEIPVTFEGVGYNETIQEHCYGDYDDDDYDDDDYDYDDYDYDYDDDDDDEWVERSYKKYYVELTYTMHDMENKIKISYDISKWFDSKSICILWLLDILFETNCLTEYINDLMNKESLSESEIYNMAKQVYDYFKITTKSLENYKRHKIRWKSNRRKKYGLKEIKMVVSNDKEEGLEI